MTKLEQVPKDCPACSSKRTTTHCVLENEVCNWWKCVTCQSYGDVDGNSIVRGRNAPQ